MTALARYTYLVLNTAVSIAAFGRNLLFMRVFDLADLGQIALMQTIVMLVGFAQVGMISGAYILWAGGDRMLNASIANLLFAGKLVLAGVAVAALLILGPDILSPTVASETLVIGVAAGIATMASSWMNNALVADQRLILSSAINVVAVTVSLAAAFAIQGTPDLVLALLAVAVQPVLVMLGVLLLDRGVRPNGLHLRLETARRVLSVGLQPYLGSLSMLALFQVERWSIVGVLGTEALGRYFIVILYLGFFALIPIALMNINFPRAVRAVQVGDEVGFRQIRFRHTLELAIYAGAALVLKLLLLVRVLELSLPQFAESTALIYLAYLAGVAFMAQDVGTLTLYAVGRTGPILTAGILTLASFSIGVFGLWLADAFSLENLLFARIVASVIGALWLFGARVMIVRARAG